MERLGRGEVREKIKKDLDPIILLRNKDLHRKGTKTYEEHLWNIDKETNQEDV